jgi:hypothetical protein
MASVNFAVYCVCAEGRQGLLGLEQFDDLTVTTPHYSAINVSK